MTLATRGPEWSIAATADFALDGHLDLVCENLLTGERSLWLMNGTTALGTVSLGIVDAASDIVGTGDFNGDGSPDILLEDAAGACSVWAMQGVSPTGTMIPIGAAGIDGTIRN